LLMNACGFRGAGRFFHGKNQNTDKGVESQGRERAREYPPSVSREVNRIVTRPQRLRNAPARRLSIPRPAAAAYQVHDRRMPDPCRTSCRSFFSQGPIFL
jgi:hypothetical protein